jgi:lipopolysaccharide export system protein LptA
VWTPKRVLLLAGGFVLFLTAYGVYSHFLGGIDGLPSLPEEYAPMSTGQLPPLPPVSENEAERKLRVAFGEDCDEAKRKIKLELEAKGVVLAAQQMTFRQDGRVLLTPFSVALFGKERPESRFPEINTVRCQEALLTFDKPVNNETEMFGRKIIAGELRGDIWIFNNRGTPQHDDDISLFTQGPLKYEEALHRIWTEEVVQVTDPQYKPKLTTIAGTGMYLYLTSDPRPTNSPPASPPKTKKETVTGVERIELRSDVEMNLWVDARSGFLGSSKNRQEGEAPAEPLPPSRKDAPPPEKAKVVITTQGPFCYNLRTDHATFDLSPRAVSRPNVVTVHRVNEPEGKYDQLDCDHLELQFHRKDTGTPQPTPDERPDGLDIESARATGKEVVLTSDAEVLEARGNDFYYDRRTHLSTLKGSPRMWALKEGNEIEAPELQLFDVKGGQQATAVGEGHIRMLDKAKGTRPLEARWKEKLIYAKDGPHDLLTLKGDATFLDHEHGQELQAQLLKVWLEPSEETAGPAESDHQRRKPHHLDAIGQVSANSPEMRVHDSERLVIAFKDAPPAQGRLPSEPPAPSAASRGGADLKSVLPDKPASGTASQSVLPEKPANGSDPPGPAKPKKPMDLSARLIKADVLRSGSKNDLDKVWCEGAVRVVQEPATPEDKAIDIRGETLQLTHHVDGNVLAVTGEQAHVQHDKLLIIGPEVNIDQTTNEAWVNGPGAMRMPSQKNFDGSDRVKPVDLVVHWNKHMLFDGKEARFWGNIQAEQDTGRLACQVMRVDFDRPVSLRDGSMNGPSPKVQKLVCDQDVWVEDSTWQGARLVSSKLIRCPVLDMDNDTETDESLVNASGPGLVRIFQLGTKGEVLPAPPSGTSSRAASAPPAGNGAVRRQPAGATKPASATPAKQEEEFKLTQITFMGKMFGNNKTRVVTFLDGVRVVHVPTDDPNLKINEDRPPPGSLNLNCERLQVLSHKLQGDRTYQEMIATGRVAVEGQAFSGRADIVKYDESMEKITLEGTASNLAVLEQQPSAGSEPEKKLKGRKIIYMRLTGEAHVEGGRGITYKP